MNGILQIFLHLLPLANLAFRALGMANGEHELDLKLTAFERMLGHDLFKKSNKQAIILKYLFTMTIEGRAAEVSEYSLAYDALGMGTDFDPTTNASIRVELSRLRKKLKLYQSEGKDLAYLFSIEPGEYLLTLKSNEVSSQYVAGKSPRELISSLMVF